MSKLRIKPYSLVEDELTILVNEPDPTYSKRTNRFFLGEFLSQNNLLVQYSNLFLNSPSITYQSNAIFELRASGDTSLFGFYLDRMNIVEVLYSTTRFYEIQNYLFKHNTLIESLIELFYEITKRFGFINPKMELITDIELPDWKTLVVSIPSSEEFETTFEKLNSLIEEWLFHQSNEFKKNVNISVL